MRATCFNLTGTRACQCNPGYAGTGTTCAPAWTPMHLVARPSPAMVFDTTRNRFVVFGGGYDYATLHGETLESPDGITWTVVATAGPSPRTAPAMTFDSARNVTVLFGGADTNGPLNDTWEWNGSRWTKLTPANIPPARHHSALAFDPMRQRSVLFGGQPSAAAQPLNDTWTWDGTNWTQGTGTAPPRRHSHTLAWQGTRQAVTLYAGEGTSAPLDDLWEWSGTAWAPRSPGATPGARFGHAAAWDPVRQRMVVVGGKVMGLSSRETWMWDGTTWSSHAMLSSSHSFGAMAFSPVASRVFILGGFTGTFDNDYTWVDAFDGTGWFFIAYIARVQPYVNFVTYDATRRRPIALGDHGINVFDGSSWLHLDNWATRPRVLRYDPSRQLSIALSTNGNTYSSDGGVFALSGSTDPAPGVVSMASTYHSGDQAVYAFGGASATKLWSWSGTTWTTVNASGPASNTGSAIAYDATRNRLVLFGGASASQQQLSATWLFNGSSWSMPSPATVPTARRDAAMAWDSVRGRVIMYGGVEYTTGSQRELNDQWEWTGTTWSPVTLDRFPGRANSLEYDATGRRLIHFSGAGDLWYRLSD